MKLFDFIKVFFNKPKEYQALSNHDKGKNRFMLNRFMAIQYPKQAEMLNVIGVKPEHVIDSWYLVAQRFQRTPGWIWTRVRAKKKVKNEGDPFEPDEDTIKHYLKKNDLSMRDYKHLLKYQRDLLLSELEELEKQMLVNG